MTPKQLKAFDENKVGWFGRLLCRPGFHNYANNWCVRCNHHGQTM